MKFEWRSYVRPFVKPLRTTHGEWRDRSGILLKLTSADGRVGYGEIAPVPWFGSETLQQAIAWCQHMPQPVNQAAIAAIPDALPACQFGLESAWEGFTNPAAPPAMPLSALLPTGAAALSAWEPLWQAGYRTFKWKIGVAALAQELTWFAALHSALPPDCHLRLDANGGLTPDQAAHWLEVGDHMGLEYLEQPLPPTQFHEMVALQSAFTTAIALDESVATLSQLRHCLEHGWRGVVIIKPAIAGSPAKLRQFCAKHSLDLVFSSVFETAIGRQAGLRLAAELGNRDRAMGYGTTQWFHPDTQNFDALWQHL
ncbi:MAG: o-succinylbenzoate synthase [Leptolyngbyaceae cyanobacterium bins.349]|nr:o-succinylbenzoate synthase [Leptolyngbyaceae cyanobacterium bins.349]